MHRLFACSACHSSPPLPPSPVPFILFLFHSTSSSLSFNVSLAFFSSAFSPSSSSSSSSSSSQWRIQDFGSGGSNFRHPGQSRQDFQGRLNHVANVSVKTGLLTKCTF